MFNWFNAIGIQNLIQYIRLNLSFLKPIIPDWTYYSLPDGLWIYSFSSFLIIYWDNYYKTFNYWLFIPFVCGIVVELLQFVKLFPGTFDIIDLFFLSLGLSLSLIILNSLLKKGKEQSQIC
jgi:hypothetical protein